MKMGRNMAKVRQNLFFLLFLIALLFLWFLFYVNGTLGIQKGDLLTADCYMRLNRVVELNQTGQWFDGVSHRSNAPYGESMHWTRPFDLLLLIGTWPLTPILGFKNALFWWGVMISPVLWVITIATLIWAARPLITREGVPYLVFLFITQLYLLTWFLAGRPDHHSLLLLVFVLSFGFTIRLLLEPFRPTLCYAAAALGAIGMWVSVEMMFPLFISIFVLGLMWIPSGNDFALKNLHLNGALFGLTGLALLLERPLSDLAKIEYDRLSIVHLCIFGFIALTWLLISIADKYSSLRLSALKRLGVLLAGISFLGFATILSFPKFIKGPFVDVDPRIISFWLEKVSESSPLLNPREPLTLLTSLTLGQAVPGFFYALGLLWRNRRGEYQKWLYVCLAVMLLVLVSLYGQARWAAYAAILLTIPLANLISDASQWASRFFTGPRKRWAQVLVGIGLSMILFLSPFMMVSGRANHNEKRLPNNVSLSNLCQYLNKEYGWENETKRILTHIFSGPEILYRTHHEVIATPYHRNAAGILCAYNIMTAVTDEQAYQKIRKRGINVIILCLESNESEIYSLPTQESTFYQRLRQNQLPSWIESLPLPTELSSSFKVFQVRRPY